MAYGESSAITATNLANFIPTILSQQVLAALENALVIGNLVDRSYEADARSGGNVIQVPNLSNLTANVVNTAVDAVAYDAIQNVTNISINKKYDVMIEVDDINQLQTNPKYLAKVGAKLTYALAKQIDSNIAATFNSYTQHVGSVHSALTEDELIQAYEYLNSAPAPDEGRAWILDPESITDLLKNDYFVRMDYVSGSVVTSGFTGKQIFGSPVYRTTNLDLMDVNAHAAAYLHREAIALVQQMAPKFETFRVPKRHADAIIGLTVFGLNCMRDTFMVCINTRS